MLVNLSKIINKLESGSRPKGGVKNASEGIPSLGAEHLNSNGGFNFNKVKFISEEFFKQQKNGIIGFEDILVVKDGATTGKVSFVDENFPYNKASINEHVFKISINKEFALPKYVFWHLFGYKGKQQILKDFRGATVGGISRSFVDFVKLPLPSIEEQKRIVRELDTADSLRQKRKQAIALLDDYLKAVFEEMFGDPITNSKDWKIQKLGEMIDFMTSGSRGWAKYYADDGDVFLRIQNVERNHLKIDDLCFVNPPDTAESKRTKVRPGDVLLSITADLGRTAVIPENFGNAYISQHLALLRFKIHYLPDYISEFLASRGGAVQMAKLNKGGTKAGLNFNDIKSIQIPIPDLKTQQQYIVQKQHIQSIKQFMLSQNKLLEINFNALIQKTFKLT